MLIQFVTSDVYTISGDCEIRPGAYLGTRTEVWLHFMKGDSADGFVGKRLLKAKLGRTTKDEVVKEVQKTYPDASVDSINGANIWED